MTFAENMNSMDHLEVNLKRIEAVSGSGPSACVTFGLPASAFAHGASQLRQEVAAAANIKSRV
jgi:hypothetical protein